GKKVDIMVTDRASTIVPIMQYHSTAVMNYITAHTFVSLYPKWMNDRKTLVNPATYMDDRTNIAMVLALTKYMQRGFDVKAEP
ncbi:uncharacterized protein F5891DRAFT_929202, partial [Suillus fuscotomentosus]